MDQKCVLEKNDDIKNNRRNFIKKLSGVIGGTAACSLLAGNSLSVAFAYSANTTGKIIKGELFSLDDMKTLALISDIILPKTDTPSGAELDCHGFLDHQLNICHSKQEQQDAVAFLVTLNQTSQQLYKKGFNQLTLQEQTQLLTNIEQGIGFNDKQQAVFKKLKALIVFGFFTTELGATKILSYQAIPGGFIGSIPYNKSSTTWGSLSFY